MFRGPAMRCLFVVSTLVMAGCVVGEVPSDPGPGSGSGDACVDRLADPQIQAHVHTAGATTNAGTACLNAGCHNPGAPGAGAPPYQFAGTVYKVDGVTPNAGITVRVKGSNNALATAISDSAGNFHVDANTLPMPFPSTTEGTVCPSTTKMITPLAAQDGDCNRGGCHAAAGQVGQGPILVMD